MNTSGFIHLLLGDEQDSSLHQRIFNLFCVMTLIMGVTSGLLNIQVAPNPYAFWLPASMSLVIAFCWYLSRMAGRLRTAAMIVFVLIIGFYTPGFWITNGGSTGGYQYFLVVIATVIAAVSRKGLRLAGLISLLLVTMGLLAFEYYHPEMIFTYPTRMARFIDIAFSITSAGVLSVGTFLVYTRAYESEQLQVEEYAARLEELAVTDHLTGVHNRAFAIQQLEALIYEAGRYELHLSIIMIDFDLFKQINDNNGHKAGDRVLVEVAKIFQTEIRASDIACRYGGEEFLIICPNSDLDETVCLADRLRQLVEQRSAREQDLYNLTLSCGIAEWQGEDADSFIDHADQAMYAAKRSGRNCFRVYNGKYEEAV